MWLNQQFEKFQQNKTMTQAEQDFIERQVKDVKEDTEEKLNDIIKTSVLGYNVKLYSSSYPNLSPSEIKSKLMELNRTSVLPIYNNADKGTLLALFNDSEFFLNKNDRTVLAYIANNEPILQKVRFVYRSGLAYCINSIEYRNELCNLSKAVEYNNGRSIVISNNDLSFPEYENKSVIWQFHHMYITNLPIYLKLDYNKEMLNFLNEIIVNERESEEE
jgi:hypothetical protein